jgi:Ni/Fe-hydrogenase subunit HybB-like protein
LALNTLIPFYLLFPHYRGRTPDKRIYVPLIILSVFWAVSIHLVMAFLYAGLPARPWWNSALMGPRFLASAFSAGIFALGIFLLTLLIKVALPIELGHVKARSASQQD